jgi:very-short-patch-repair endonuclease
LSVSEDEWIVFCERTDTPKPDAINARIHGVLCDAVYGDASVIVELDGAGNHHSPTQIRRDRANDRLLRGHGWLVLRYTWHDVHGDPLGVRADLLAALRSRSRSWAPNNGDRP